jgi:hypothetical protein|tara:strand:+ start:1347 stop:1535 length:189 start_codon:yes stop_codon:yes gene_type:complete
MLIPLKIDDVEVLEFDELLLQGISGFDIFIVTFVGPLNSLAASMSASPLISPIEYKQTAKRT